MKIPKVQAYDGSLQVVDTFGGLNRAEKIREGEWNETLNLSSDNYPLLSTRKKRTLLGTRTRDIYDMIVKGNTIYTVEEDDGTYYLCGGTSDVELPSESKGLVSMGAYIIVLGANIWYNTADGTHGSIDAEMESPSEDITASGMTYSYVLKLCPCESDGTELRIVEEIPENQQEAWEESTTFAHDGECFAVGTKRLIRQRHGDNSSMWWETKDLFLRVEADGIDDGINVGDVINLSGIPTAWVNGSGVYREDRQPSDIEPTSQPYFNVSSRYADDPNGLREVVYVGSGFIVVKDVYFPYRVTVSETAADGVASERRMPDMDFVVEAQNRLWGCKHGIVDGEIINEIYASALGDFKNWRKYDGTSMASWAASVGTDGDWTGAISYNGAPYFFKRNYMHRVYPSAYGAHQIRDYELDGVRANESGSLCVVQERIFWKGSFGIYAFAGDSPVRISDAVGREYLNKLYATSAGGANGKVYFSVYGVLPGQADMFMGVLVYDIRHMIWNVEDSAGIIVGKPSGPVAAVDYVGDVCNIADLLGLSSTSYEAPVQWSCTSGLIGYETVEQKEFYRMDLRLELGNNATMKLEIEYDSDGVWHEEATQSGTGIGSVVIPVRPRRCDHFRIRLSGTGQMKLWSIAKRYRRGSDVT